MTHKPVVTPAFGTQVRQLKKGATDVQHRTQPQLNSSVAAPLLRSPKRRSVGAGVRAVPRLPECHRPGNRLYRGRAADPHVTAHELAAPRAVQTGGAAKTLAQLRAPLGVSAGVWFVAHTLASLHLFDLAAPLLPQLFAADIIVGTVALVIFVALLLTSNTASQRRMGKHWKTLQRLVWFSLLLAVTHALLSSVRFLGEP